MSSIYSTKNVKKIKSSPSRSARAAGAAIERSPLIVFFSRAVPRVLKAPFGGRKGVWGIGWEADRTGGNIIGYKLVFSFTKKVFLEKMLTHRRTYSKISMKKGV